MFSIYHPFKLFFVCFLFVFVCARSPLSCLASLSLSWVGTALLLWSTGSRRTGFRSCNSQALEPWASSWGARASCSAACGVFPDRDQAHVPCTGGQILTPGPLRKSHHCLFIMVTFAYIMKTFIFKNISNLNIFVILVVRRKRRRMLWLIFSLRAKYPFKNIWINRKITAGV